MIQRIVTIREPSGGEIPPRRPIGSRNFHNMDRREPVRRRRPRPSSRPARTIRNASEQPSFCGPSNSEISTKPLALFQSMREGFAIREHLADGTILPALSTQVLFAVDRLQPIAHSHRPTETFRGHDASATGSLLTATIWLRGDGGGHAINGQRNVLWILTTAYGTFICRKSLSLRQWT